MAEAGPIDGLVNIVGERVPQLARGQAYGNGAICSKRTSSARSRFTQAMLPQSRERWAVVIIDWPSSLKLPSLPLRSVYINGKAAAVAEAFAPELALVRMRTARAGARHLLGDKARPA